MDDYYKFEWDEDKNISNQIKHRVDFNDAMDVWNDPQFYERYDADHSLPDEERWIVTGKSSIGILFVVYTDKVHSKENNIRIIMAREADASEIKEYETMAFSRGY